MENNLLTMQGARTLQLQPLHALASAVPGTDLCPHLGSIRPIRPGTRSFVSSRGSYSTGVIAGCRSTSSMADKRGNPDPVAYIALHITRKQTPACSLLGCPVTGYDPTKLCLTSNCYILGSLPLMAAHLTRPEGRNLLVSNSSRTGHAGHNLLNHCHEPMLPFLIYPDPDVRRILDLRLSISDSGFLT